MDVVSGLGTPKSFAHDRVNVAARSAVLGEGIPTPIAPEAMRLYQKILVR